jgi:hypothetical protein
MNIKNSIIVLIILSITIVLNISCEEWKERREKIAEIEQLENKKLNAQLTEMDLNKIEVRQANLSRDTYSITNTISMIVKNNTEYAISSIYFNANYQTPGRQIPYGNDDFRHSFSGGLEPSEEKSIRVLTSGSRLSFTRIQPGAILTVKVTNINGPDGTSLLGLSNWEMERLNYLREKIDN